MKLASFVYPYINITFNESIGDSDESMDLKRSDAYAAIETYLSGKSSREARNLKAVVVKDSSQPVQLSMDENEGIIDEFKGVKLSWTVKKNTTRTQSFSIFSEIDKKKYYKLTFHKSHRDLVCGTYINHVIQKGKEIAVSNRQRKLYTNNPSKNWERYKAPEWSRVTFEHPATFDTLAMESKKKLEIVNDLEKFSKGKEYYTKIGKVWKRGYLLYGPPGTGKSSMIAAMANHLEYDIYNLELTTVKDNTELKRLLIKTTGKSIIVIEDIDCLLELTGQRKNEKKKAKDEEAKDPISKMTKGEEDSNSKVTFSGLLNFVDFWPAIGGERIIVFTTNYVEKLDALIRRGRMDKYIELSYCGFEAFKVLAKNYLDVDSHPLFATIGHLLEETNITPADVAENLMPKSLNEDAEACLKKLIEAIETAKEEATKKAEEEARLKAEKEEKEKLEATQEDVKIDESLAKDVKENGVEVVKDDKTLAAESSIPMTEGAIESSLPITATDSSLPMTQGATAEECSLPITQDTAATESSVPMTQGATAAEPSLPMTQGTATVEYSSAMTQAATESSLPMTRGAAESSLPTGQTPNIRNEADVPINTQSNQDSLQDLFSFKSLKVSEISQLRKLPMGLHSLKIERCDALEFIPEQVMVCSPPVQHLYIISCCSLKSFSGGSPPTALKFLYIQNCKKLKFLPLAEKTHHYALLEHLCIGSSCDSLVFLPLDLFPKLKILSIWDCANLESFSMPGRIQKDLTSLEALEIRDCPNLLSFPKGGLLTPNLKSIWFSNCKNLKELPDQLHTLSSLRSMFINNCPELLSLPEGGLPSNLSLLCITFCDKMMLGMEWGLHRLDYLSRLEIEGACKNVVSFPEAELLPRHLNSLRISGLLNLKYLNYRGLQHLTALKILEISCCNKLQSLPEEGLPASLSFLCIKECSLLKLKLQDKTGKDWSKIAHISCIEIDEELCHEEV
nr:aaa-atpase asd, mitochondrial [Quercus suber]